MSFKGRIIEGDDPDYIAEFIYRSGNTVISGMARIVRKQPKLEISYCNLSADKVRMLGEEDLTKLELEITNLVLNDLLKKKNKGSLQVTGRSLYAH
jgi:hypothetical protein